MAVVAGQAETEHAVVARIPAAAEAVHIVAAGNTDYCIPDVHPADPADPAVAD